MLEVLKYVLLVLGIVAVGALIIWGLASLVLSIIEPHGNKNEQNNYQGNQITYEPQKLLTKEPVQEATVVAEYVPEFPEDVKEVDYEKAKAEEDALSAGTTVDQLSAEEEQFIREKQKAVEERLASKTTKEEEINLDDIFIEDETSETSQTNEEDDDEDIEALINKILAGDDEEILEEELENQEENVSSIVEEASEVEEVADETLITDESKPLEENIQETPVEETAEFIENQEKIKELEEELARQKQEYEEKIKLMEQANQEQENQEEQANDERVAELERQLEEQKSNNERIAELERMLAEKEAEKESLILDRERIIKETETKVIERTVGPTLSLEEYEQRLETLKERLKNNEKDLKPVKKEYLPLAKIKKTLEKDNTKLRRKEALVAKQKVMLYGVNNYVDIDEEKAKKLSEDLDLLEGLRLSVQHCEEVMKNNEERYPILESSYKALIEMNTNIKADIEDCMNKIAELKSQNSDEE